MIENGRPNFSSLQADLSEGRTAAPLNERKKVLERLLTEAQLTGPVLYSQHEEDAALTCSRKRAQ